MTLTNLEPKQNTRTYTQNRGKPLAMKAAKKSVKLNAYETNKKQQKKIVTRM